MQDIAPDKLASSDSVCFSLTAAFSFHQSSDMFETFIFLLKFHRSRAHWKNSLNMQNCVHRPLYGCPVMYFWDMQIWHFCDCSSILASSLLLSLSHCQWEVKHHLFRTADCSICLYNRSLFYQFRSLASISIERKKKYFHLIKLSQIWSHQKVPVHKSSQIYNKQAVCCVMLVPLYVQPVFTFIN